MVPLGYALWEGEGQRGVNERKKGRRGKGNEERKKKRPERDKG